jgi:hypothetical protein
VNDVDRHFKQVVRKMLNGIVVPLLGAGVNLSGRPPNFEYSGNQRDHLPSGRELAAYLAAEFDYPELANVDDLLRVSQFLEVMEGSGELYQALHSLFDADYPPRPVHTFLAELQPTLREHGKGGQVILTTNYDDALERAFVSAGEEYDLITYVCTNPVAQRGRFMHFPPGDAAPLPIVTPNEYDGLDLSKRPVILKMHGAVTRGRTFEEDNYVITEDHYIDYLTHTDITNLLPHPIPTKLRNSHFLFLGYGMRDWNLRVILRRIWGAQALEFPSWSIQVSPDKLETKFWEERKVDILDYDIDDYVERLRTAVKERLAERVVP